MQLHVPLGLKNIVDLIWNMRRGKINTHNPLEPPDRYEYIQLAPGYVREVVEAYDGWPGKEQVPQRVKDLIMIFRIELSRRYDR